MPKIDFAAYARQLAAENNTSMMLPVIEKELLHYEILRAMAEAGLLSSLTFQGGTCLRLCYGAVRYSEDLDFAGGVDFKASDLQELKDCITETLPEKYAATLRVDEPESDISLIKKWRIKIDTAPERPDLPVQKISLEVAAVEAHTKQPQMLQLNYVGLPNGYEDTIVSAESLEEILADKLEAFVCSRYIRYRDLWDMYWIKRRPAIDLEKVFELRRKKENDYGEREIFARGLTRVADGLESIVNGKEFSDQMKRFLPTEMHAKTVGRAEFRALLLEGIRELYVGW